MWEWLIGIRSPQRTGQKSKQTPFMELQQSWEVQVGQHEARTGDHVPDLVGWLLFIRNVPHRVVVAPRKQEDRPTGTSARSFGAPVVGHTAKSKIPR